MTAQTESISCFYTNLRFAYCFEIKTEIFFELPLFRLLLLILHVTGGMFAVCAADPTDRN